MEDLRIESLSLKNVGVFESLSLSFTKKPLRNKAEIHIFTGQNGTGKTTILEALSYFDSIYNTSLPEEKKNGRLLDILHQKMSKLKKDESIVGIYFNKAKLEFLPHGGASLVDDNYFKSYYSDFDPKYHYYNFFAYNGHRQLRDSKVEAFKQYDSNPIKEALVFDKINANVFQWIANNKTRAALSFQKGNKKDSEHYQASFQKIETAIGEIIGRKVEFIIDERSLNIMVKLDEKSVHFNTLADGYKSVISWLIDLVFRLDYMPKEGQENFTLFLDEIDVHLHPAAQRRILPVIQKLFPKAQIFLTTHSPFVIGSIDDAWIYKFKLDEKGNSVLDGDPFLSEDGKSYRYILDEVFDIKKNFGVDVEKQLEHFYKKRDEIIKKKSSDLLKELKMISKSLASQSEELRAIIGSELKQLSRILKKEITL